MTAGTDVRAYPVTVRRVPFAELLLVGDTMLAGGVPGTVPVALRTVDAAHYPALVELLAFCGAGRDLVDALLHLRQHGLDADEAAEVMACCLRAGLLVSGDTAGATTNGPATVTRQSDVDRFLAVRRARRYFDYGDSAVFQHDRDAMRELIAQSPPPPVQTPFDGPRVDLPHPALRHRPTALTAVSRVLFHGFGQLRPARFLDLLDVAFKTVPSFGARHPFDAYLVVPPGQPVPAGRYGYLPSEHRLCAVPDDPVPSNPAGVFTVQIVAVFERVQWRYRQSVAYESLLLDLGHLLATIRAGAADAGLRISRSHRRTPVVPGTTLRAETFAQLNLISEAVGSNDD